MEVHLKSVPKDVFCWDDFEKTTKEYTLFNLCKVVSTSKFKKALFLSWRRGCPKEVWAVKNDKHLNIFICCVFGVRQVSVACATTCKNKQLSKNLSSKQLIKTTLQTTAAKIGIDLESFNIRDKYIFDKKYWLHNENELISNAQLCN